MSGSDASPSSPVAAPSGHVLPALAVAEALVAAGHDPATIHYVGAQRGVETRTAAGHARIRTTFLDVVGVTAPPDAAQPGLRAEDGAQPAGPRSACLRDWRPRVVVSVGGYASMPAVFAARRSRSPSWSSSYDRRRAERVGWPPICRSLCRGLRELAAAAGRDDRRPGTPGDPRHRPTVGSATPRRSRPLGIDPTTGSWSP